MRTTFLPLFHNKLGEIEHGNFVAVLIGMIPQQTWGRLNMANLWWYHQEWWRRWYRSQSNPKPNVPYVGLNPSKSLKGMAKILVTSNLFLTKKKVDTIFSSLQGKNCSFLFCCHSLSFVGLLNNKDNMILMSCACINFKILKGPIMMCHNTMIFYFPYLP